MPELADVVTSESVQRLYDKFKAGVEWLPQTEAGDVGLTADTFEEVGVHIAKWAHHQLWENSYVSSAALRAGFERETRKSTTMASIFADVVKAPPNRTHARVQGDTGRVLTRAGLAQFAKHSRTWYLNPWDESKLSWVGNTHSIKRDPKVEKRIEEEANTPVVTKIDLRSFKLPDADPEAIMSFIEKFVPAALKVQDSYVELLSNFEDLQAQVESEGASRAWAGIATRVEELLNK